MGMRGSGDTALSAGIETQLLEDVVASQREILAQVFGNASVMNPNAVPQLWCLVSSSPDRLAWRKRADHVAV
jgi:hypothetical protein